MKLRRFQMKTSYFSLLFSWGSFSHECTFGERWRLACTLARCNLVFWDLGKKIFCLCLKFGRYTSSTTFVKIEFFF